MNTIQFKIAEKSNQAPPVSLWIDAYTDLFSDFDPRPFEERGFSDDFIAQVRKVSKDAKDKVSVLRILAPRGDRSEAEERTIRKRLENYFYNNYQQLLSEAKKIRFKGFYFTLSGVVLMIISSYIYYLKLPGFYPNLLLVILEPAGWFLLWNGLDLLITFAKSKKADIAFYEKLSGVHVEFGSYE